MKLFGHVVFTVIVGVPLMVWLQPPWYATFSVGVLVSMVITAAFKS